jgi:hypothetical protein
MRPTHPKCHLYRSKLDCRATLIKFDVEGGEDDAVRNGRRTLSKAQAVIIETVSDKAHDALSQTGFMRGYYAPFKRLLSAASPVPAVQMSNSLYVKDFDFAFRRLESAPAVTVSAQLKFELFCQCVEHVDKSACDQDLDRQQ